MLLTVVVMEVRGNLSLHKMRSELGKSEHLRDILTLPNLSQCLVYSSTSNSGDNRYCGCLYSLMFVRPRFGVGAALGGEQWYLGVENSCTKTSHNSR
jgi:hypothetical protein